MSRGDTHTFDQTSSVLESYFLQSLIIFRHLGAPRKTILVCAVTTTAIREKLT